MVWHKAPESAGKVGGQIETPPPPQSTDRPARSLGRGARQASIMMGHETCTVDVLAVVGAVVGPEAEASGR